MTSRLTFAVGFLTVSAAVVYGQTAPNSVSATSTRSGFRGSSSFGPPPSFARPVVKGAPYSGEEISERVQTGTDGTRFTQTTMQRKVYRDSEGRIRNERPLVMGGPMANVPESPTVIEISDPVAGFQYILDPLNKVAHRQALPEPSSRMDAMMRKMAGGGMGMASSGAIGGIIGSVPSAAPPPPGRAMAAIQIAPVQQGQFGACCSETAPAPANRAGQGQMMPRMADESLGTRTIDGVLVEGSRHTATYPVGMMGNDREFSTTSEMWTSPELKLMVMSKNSDPRSGENTFRIANLSRTPPDVTLFMVPSDYTIVDEKGSFTVTFGQ